MENPKQENIREAAQQRASRQAGEHPDVWRDGAPGHAAPGDTAPDDTAPDDIVPDDIVQGSAVQGYGTIADAAHPDLAVMTDPAARPFPLRRPASPSLAAPDFAAPDFATTEPAPAASTRRSPASPAAAPAHSDSATPPYPAAPPSTGAAGRAEAAPIATPVADHPDLAAVAPRRRNNRKRLVLGGVLAAILAVGGYETWHWVDVGQYLVSTDDAYVEADLAQLSARATGYVARVLPENSVVKKGDVVMALDDTDYRIALQAAQDKVETQTAALARVEAQIEVQRSAIAQARAQVTAGEAQVRRAEADYGRAAALLATVAGNRQNADRALAERDQARANVELAKAQVAQAEANLGVVQAQRVEAQKVLAEYRTQVEKARRDLDYATLRAPADGVFGNKGVDVGALVQPGTRVGALVPRAGLHVTANFKETQLAGLKPGQKVEVAVDALGGGRIEGRIESFAPGSGSVFSLLPPENATGNFTKIVQRVPVRIALPDGARLDDARAQRVLRPGLSVVVTVDTRDDGKSGGDMSSDIGGDTGSDTGTNTAELKR